MSTRKRSRHDAGLIGYWRKWHERFFERNHQIIVRLNGNIVVHATPESWRTTHKGSQRGVTLIELP